ncbi:hypothetical protein Hanom_Chr08g00740701 [Helianthus anomalus]
MQNSPNIKWNPLDLKVETFFDMSKLQVLSFMFTSNCRRCPFSQNFTSGVLYLSKSCTFCPLSQTWLENSVKKSHVQGIWG